MLMPVILFGLTLKANHVVVDIIIIVIVRQALRLRQQHWRQHLLVAYDIASERGIQLGFSSHSGR